jgi:hypothetical protein
MRRNVILGTAGAMAAASCITLGAARSCSFERSHTGFDAYLPLGEAKAGISCTSWIGSSGICYAGDLSGPASLELRGSARYGKGFIGMPVPFTRKRLEVDADAKSRTVDVGLEGP